MTEYRIRQVSRIATLLSIVFLASALGEMRAQADMLIDFDDVGPGGFLTFEQAGVTITQTNGGFLTGQFFGPTPNGTFGLSATGSAPLAPLRADIATNATSVAIDLGDFGADEDLVFLEAYTSSGVLVDRASAFLPADFVGMVTLDVSAPVIAYVIYGGEGLNGNSVYTDNFRFSPVPEPATAHVICIGFALAFVRRQRQ